MAMIQQPLAPPPTHGNLPPFTRDEFIEINSDSDSNIAVQRFLDLHCPNLNVNDLPKTHNRVSIPIQ
jgi:hypothetical protein